MLFRSGPVGVLPNHAPLLGNLFRGVLMVRDISGKEFNEGGHD